MVTEASSITANPAKTKHRFFEAILFVLLLGEIAFLLSDLNLISIGSGLREPRASLKSPPIAELVSKQNTVRAQNPGEIIWEETQSGQTLYRKQSLLTSGESKAEVAFLDGTGLSVDENSMIELEKSPANDSVGYERIVVTLVRGTVHKTSPKKKSQILREHGAPGGATPEFVMSVGNALATFGADTELTVIATPEQEGSGAKILLHNGELSLETPSGKTVARHGEEITVGSRDSQAPPVSRKATFTLLSPRAGAKLPAKRDQAHSVPFRWLVDEKQIVDSAMELQLSTDPSFALGALKRVRIAATNPPLKQGQVSVSFGPGELRTPWHWRVVRLRDDASSRVEGFFFDVASGPELTHPAPSSIVRVRPPHPLADVGFSWKRVEQALSYQIELKLGEGKPIVRQIRGGDTWIQVKSLLPGSYRWRVRAENRDGSVGEWSETRALRVEIGVPAVKTKPEAETPVAEDTAPPPPELLEDAEVESVPPAEMKTPDPKQSWMEWILPSANAAEAETQASPSSRFRLKWKAVPGVERYKVQVARRSSFSEVLAEAETPSPEWSWDYQPGMENSKGRVFYRVASISKSGKIGAYSKPKPVSIPSHLRSARAAVKKSPPQEVFEATDAAAGPTVPDDLSDGENLSALAQPVAPAPKAGVSVSELEKVRSVPAPAPELSERVQSLLQHQDRKEAQSYSHWSFSAAFSTGIGSQKQSSSLEDNGFQSVQPASAYLQQKLRLRADWVGTLAQEKTRHWTLELGASASSFDEPDDDGRISYQEKVNHSQFHVDLLAWPRDHWNAATGWGLTIDSAARWVKTGPQTVDPQSTFSAGPALQWNRNVNLGSNSGIAVLGGRLSAPITGVLTSGQYGIRGGIWAEYRITRLGASDWIGLRAEFEASYLRWSQPKGTGKTEWVILIAPTIHLLPPSHASVSLY